MKISPFVVLFMQVKLNALEKDKNIEKERKKTLKKKFSHGLLDCDPLSTDHNL